jgi:hypothetical protein
MTHPTRRSALSAIAGLAAAASLRAAFAQAYPADRRGPGPRYWLG